MLGAIIGDMVGSVYEARNIKTKDFDLFNIHIRMTDDSLLTIALAKTLINHFPLHYEEKELKTIQGELIVSFSQTCQDNIHAGWGKSFFEWSHKPLLLRKPYNSFGNGAAMRISPVGWIAKSESEVKLLSQAVTEITHNHQEGLKGAEAIAMCVFLAKTGKTKKEIEEYVAKHYYPNIRSLDYEVLVRTYRFDVTCQGSVPHAIYCFLISTDFEDAIRTAVSIGGDCDTITSMTAAIAEAFYQKSSLSSLEDQFLYLFVDPELEQTIIRFYSLFHSQKFALQNRKYS